MWGTGRGVGRRTLSQFQSWARGVELLLGHLWHGEFTMLLPPQRLRI